MVHNCIPDRANSVFWTRALNIPLPHSYVFPQIQETEGCSSSIEKTSEVSICHDPGEELVDGGDEKSEVILPSHLIVYYYYYYFFQSYLFLKDFLHADLTFLEFKKMNTLNISNFSN